MKTKKRVFTKENAEATQRAIKKRFGNDSGVDIREAEGHIRIIEKNPEPKKLYLEAKFEEREEAGETLTGLSFSSEEPVMVYGEPEILIHEGTAADFSRLMEVGAILKNHDPDQIVGVPVKVWIDDKRRGNLLMRWGSTIIAMEAKREALIDKTLRGVSVGYMVREWIYLRDKTESYKEITGPAWVAVKWDALEASLTPIAADPSVGLERMVRDIKAQITNKQEIIVEMKKLKLLRAWKASDGKSYDVGAKLEVDERTFAELTEGENPFAEADNDAPKTRSVKQETEPETKSEPKTGIDDGLSESMREFRESMREESRAEAKRCADIRTVCKRSAMPELADELIAEGKTMEESQRAVLDKMVENQKASGQPATGIEITRDSHESFRSAAVDGLLLRAGQVKIEKPAPGSDEIRGKSLLRLAEESLVRAGIKVPSDVRKLVELAMRGSEIISGSTSDFPLILANTANKSLLAGYEVGPATYEFWARTGSLNDFKSASRIKFSEVGKLRELQENAKYSETSRTEKRETIQLGTYANKWTMSRQGVINDDLGAFTNTLFSSGMQAKMLPNDLGIAVLNDNDNMTDGSALFSTVHGNYSQETNRRLDSVAHAAAALKYMIGLMAKQKSYQHNAETDGARYLNLRPKIWLVSLLDELYARQVVASMSDITSTNAGVENPFKNLGITVVGDQNIATSDTDYKHLLFADPRMAPVVEVAFLQGNKMPFMQEMDQTDSDGKVWLCRLDCGAAAVDSVGAVMETGTDE